MLFSILFFITALCLNSVTHSSPLSVTSGGTGASSITAYSLISGGITSTGSLQTVSPGTAGQVLTSAGANALPTWTKPNGLILLKVLTASSSASLTFTSTDFSTAFSVFLLVIEGFDPSAVSVALTAQWSTNNGSSYLTSGYSSGTNTLTYNSATVTNINLSTALQLGSASSGQHSGMYYLFGMNGRFAASTGPCLLGFSFPAFNPTPYGMSIGSISGNPNVNNLKLLYPSGTIVTGRAYLYGLVY